MRPMNLWPVGLLLMVACGGDKPSTDETAAATDSGMPMPMVAPNGADGSAPAPGTPLPLKPVGSGGMSGTATLARRDSTLEIALAVRGKPSATLQAHVHRGRCDRDEGVAVPLTPVTTGADSAGTSTTTVPMKALTGDLFVQVHGDGSAPMLCAELPAGAS
jgi:hypothetical protein